MNELQVFQYNSMEVRTVRKDGEPWFVLKDVCQVLDISHVKDTADRLDQDEVGQTEVTDRLGRKQMTTIISESGLYAVILRSDKPEAKPFRKWVTAEVLPSIRKNGGYIMGQESMAPEELLAQALLVAQRTLEEQAAKLETLEVENRKLINELHQVPPVDTWSESEFNRMLACALEHNREDFITVLFLSRRLGLTYSECFGIETETAKKAYKEKVLTVRGRGEIPLDLLSRQRLRRHLMLDNPGRRLLIPDRRWMSQTVGAFQAFLEVFWPYAQDKGSDRSMTFHGLRHTCAAEWYKGFIQKQPNPYQARKSVSKLLGHGRDDVTRIYLASLKEGEQDG